MVVFLGRNLPSLLALFKKKGETWGVWPWGAAAQERGVGAVSGAGWLDGTPAGERSEALGFRRVARWGLLSFRPRRNLFPAAAAAAVASLYCCPQ